MESKSAKTAFPKKKTLKRVRNRLSDPSYKGSNLALPLDADEANRAKYQICQLIARYQREHRLLQKDIAEKIGADDSRVSDILRGKVESFTLDRLIGYAAKLHPGMRIHILTVD